MPSTTRSFLRRAAAIGVAAATAGAPAAYAQQAGGKPAADSTLSATPNAVRGDELNERQKVSVERGLSWLAARQAQDAAFTQHGYSNHAGITALAGLAFMEA